jgi:hypothetical protein
MAASAFFVYFPITDADIFWHLAAGREMIAHGLLFTDPFAFTLDSPRWVDLHWLFQLLCYGLYLLGGLKALLFFKLAAVAATTGILCLTHRSKHYPLIAALLAPPLVYTMRYLLCVRPLLVTLLCMAVYVFLFERGGRSGRKRLLLLCVPIQILWTNSQGLYPIGLFIIGAYWAENTVRWIRGGRTRPVFETALLLACSLSCLINPYGFAGLGFPFRLFGRIAPGSGNLYSLTISENVPLFSLAGYESLYRTVTIGVAAIACLLLTVNRGKCRLSHLILFAGFGGLAFGAVRNVPLFFVGVIPIIGANAADLLQSDVMARLSHAKRQFLAAEAIAVGVLTVGALAFRHLSIVSLYPPHRVLSPFRFPEKITDYLERNPLPGTMFNDLRYGGYLIWRLYPEKKVFIDTRLIIRSPQFFAEYLAMSDRPELFDRVAAKFNITQVILPTALYSLHLKLVRRLYASPSWRLAFTDGASVLFLRSDVSGAKGIDLADEAQVRAITDGISAQWKDAPAVKKEALGYLENLKDSLCVETRLKQ